MLIAYVYGQCRSVYAMRGEGACTAYGVQNVSCGNFGDNLENSVIRLTQS